VQLAHVVPAEQPAHAPWQQPQGQEQHSLTAHPPRNAAQATTNMANIFFMINLFKGKYYVSIII
jgi:hypothetical protein